MKKGKSNHSFIICAYKEEPNLELCVKSLKKQTMDSKVYISTSTPNEFIKKIAKKYDVELLTNKETKGHANDFRFAFNQAKTKYVTLCHQDDIYYPTFGEEVVKKMNKYKSPIIAFTNYDEIRNEEVVKNNKLLIIKRLLNFPIKIFKKSKFIRKRMLSLGNAICAPTVTYNKEIVSNPITNENLKANLDWASYIEMADIDGEFVYISKHLLGRRIHEDSLTTSVIENNIMREENYYIFNKFWPSFIAKILTRVYSTSEKSNEIKEKGASKKMECFMIILYLVFTILGLILYKKGTNQEFLINISNGNLQLKMSVLSIVGLLCYVCSFLIYILILPRFNLTYIMPLMSAFSSISIYILSILVFKESLTVYGIVGSIIILVGVLILNIGGK